MINILIVYPHGIVAVGQRNWHACNNTSAGTQKSLKF